MELNEQRAEARSIWRKKISDMIAGNAISAMQVDNPVVELGHVEEEIS